ncbi:unnamed protein product [Knipowitschia caucasica]|uniref:Caspase 3 n=1 Tax=Knipowitschia caucasica TaxID=637954 RepID=A0AAV2MLI5_KNICA
MAERDQIVQETVDAAICTAVGDKTMQTLSSVRAGPTVQISDDDWKYDQKFPSIGVCMIINNKTFLPQTGMKPRPGTEKDADAAKKTFGNLGYKVTVHNDLTKKQIETALEKVSKQDHSKNASFVCVILSHGNEDGIFGTDKLITLEDITKYFKGDKCKTLVGKPKLFFLQACRGTKLDEGVILRGVEEADGPLQQKIPVEADFLYAYATAPGYIAWRNETNGSWFIQSLCGILSKHKDLELLHIMTRVNRKVAFEFQSNVPKDPALNEKKEIPCFTSMLTKEFYFTIKP